MKRLLLGVAFVGSVAACAPAPTPAPSATPTAEATAAAALDPTPSASSAPALVPASDASAYVQGDPVTIRLDADGAGTWTLPSTVPLVGDPAGDTGASSALGFTLLPVDCPPLGALSIAITGQPFNPAPWESVLTAGETGVWSYPSSAVSPSCLDGVPSTYLSVGYQAVEAGAPLEIQVSMSEAPSDATLPAQLTFVPVYARDASGVPYRTMTESVTVGGDGSGRARGSTPRRVLRTAFDTPARLPDGSLANRFAIQLTGCGALGAKATDDLTVTLVVGDAQPLELGWCGESGIAVTNNELPVPAPGTPLVVYASGGTDGSAFRLSTFEWRAPPEAP